MFNRMGMMVCDSMARELYQFILQTREQARAIGPQRIS